METGDFYVLVEGPAWGDAQFYGEWLRPQPKHKYFGKTPYKISNLQRKAKACALFTNQTSELRRL